MKALGLTLALTCLAPAAAADGSQAEPRPGPGAVPRSIPAVPADGEARSGDGEVRHQGAEIAAPVVKVERVRFKRPLAPQRSPAELPLLLRLHALETRAGEALVELDRERRTLRPGDLLGTDVVQVADEGLLVLERPATPGQNGGPGWVIVRFDPAGKPKVRVIYEQDATAPPVAEPAR